MAIHNSYTVYINGRSKTYSAVMPPKFGNFLDERLDEATISLRYSHDKIYAPLSPVEITRYNELYWSEQGDGMKRIKTHYLVVAEDSSTESPPGKKHYNHELYCIEVTKVAERVVVDSITDTNVMGRNYAKNYSKVEPEYE